MTLREYINANYSDLSDFVNVGLFDRCNKVFFPNKNDVPTNLLMLINYEPFNYSEENGGVFTSFVTNYILSNYIDNELNPRYLSMGRGIPALQNQIMLLMCKYRYKWQALYKSTTIDNEYNMLDNVNEIFDETVTRTPNLTTVKNGENTYGERENNLTSNYGNKSKNVSTTYGAVNENNTESIGKIDTNTDTTHGKQTNNVTNNIGAVNNTDSENIGNREDGKTTVHGNIVTNSTSTDKVSPFDDSNNSYQTNVNISDTTTNSYTDTETNTQGQQLNSSTHTESARIDTSSSVVDSYTDNEHSVREAQNNSSTHTENERIDTTSLTDQAYVDTSQNIEKTHTDKASESTKESGEETTVYTRRRHGNIGVTTSGQLIDDYRKTHYFDLVKIVANDIINEILNMFWEA